MWLWIASAAKTKIILVMQVGPRHQEMAFSVVHELEQRIASGCVPVFSAGGLKHYYYALTAHFGKWEMAEGKKPVWVVLNEFVYGQVIKHQRWVLVGGNCTVHRATPSGRIERLDQPVICRARESNDPTVCQ